MTTNQQETMTTPALHHFVLSLDGEDVNVGFVCLDTRPDKPCSSWTERREPWAPGECACTDPECGCREDDHGTCGEYGSWIDDLNWSCRCERTGECWYVEQVDELGGEALEMPPVEVHLPVDLMSGSASDPIEFYVRPEPPRIRCRAPIGDGDDVEFKAVEWTFGPYQGPTILEEKK